MLTQDYFSASWWSYLSFQWLNPLLVRGADTHVIDPEDCSRLGPDEDTFKNVTEFCTHLEEQRKKSHPLIRAFCSMFWLGLLANEAINLSAEILVAMAPLMLQRLLIFQEAQTSNVKISAEDTQRGVAAAVGLVVISFVAIIVGTHGGFYKVRLGTRMEQALAGSILMRCNNATPKDDSKVFNVLSFDVGPNVNIVFVIIEMCLFPLRIFFHAALLFYEVGWTFLPGLAVVVVVMVLNLGLLTRDGQLRDVHLERKDIRMERTQEVIENARQIQILERQDMVDRVMEARKNEMSIVWRRLGLQCLHESLSRVLATFATLVTFYIILRNEGKMLTASTVMTVVMFISQLITPIESIPHWFHSLFIWKSAYARVNAYLSTDTQGSGSLEYSLEFGVRSDGAIVGFSPDPESVPLSRFSLDCGDFSLESKDKIQLTGDRGSGKSCFLQALCGNMCVFDGVLHLPRSLPQPVYPHLPASTQEYFPVEGKYIAVAPQSPCILNKSVRENIILGSPFVPTVYNCALDAVCLREEVMNWPLVDETILVTNGENISGGQAARVQLARTVYHALVATPMFVLLDTPYHSMDAATARTIHHNLFATDTGLLRDVAVVLTGEIPINEACWRHISIVDGRLLEDAAPKQPNLFAGNPQEDMVAPSPPRKQDYTKETISCGTLSAQTISDQQIHKEYRSQGLVRLEAYKVYLHSAGRGLVGVASVILFLLILIEQARDLFVSYWSDGKHIAGQHILDSAFMRKITVSVWGAFYWYAVLVASFAVLVLVGYVLEVIAGVYATQKIFANAFLGVVSKPFSWWNQNPQGRVYNRMCSDVDVMDEAVTITFGILFCTMVYCVCHIALLCAMYSVTLLWLPFLIYFFEYFASYYRSTVRELYRILLVQRSPVLQTCVDAITNFSVLRCYNASRWACWDGLLHFDMYKRTDFTLWAVKLWVSLRLRLLGSCITSINAMYPLVIYFSHDTKSVVSAGMVGLTIVYMFELQQMIQKLVFYFSDMEMQMISVERLHEWAGRTEMDTPDPFFVDNSLVVSSLFVCYEAECAISDVSFSLNHNDVCIITGRTGSGKSSLALSLIRAVPYTGRIQLGRYDLAQVCPRKFRRRFAAFCSQEPVIFRGTYHFNIGPDYTHDEIVRAMHLVGLNAQPQDVVSQLSGTDKQLLSVARAVVRSDVRLVVLDEVTACLPLIEANNFLRSTMALMKTSTRLIITHQDIHIDQAKHIHLSRGRLVSVDE